MGCFLTVHGIIVNATVQFSQSINNYWMRLSKISKIIQTEVNVICQSEAEGLGTTESNNCFFWIEVRSKKTIIGR